MILPEVAAVTGVVVTEKFAEVEPAATVTDEGTLAALLALARVTTTPPAGAAEASVTVPVDGCPPITDDGLTARELNAGALITGLYPSWITSKSLAVKLRNAGLSMSLFQRVS